MAYGLLLPGLAWLLVFFVVPMYFLGQTSLETGSYPTFNFNWAWHNYSDAITTYHTQFIRSAQYAGIATLLALLISYPLAYWIAFRAGRYKNLFLLLVIAPFFVTYLVRTLAWETILADNGLVVSVLKDVHILGPEGRLLATSAAVIAGITYNFMPFMVLPLYVSLDQIDARLLDAAKDLYANSRQSFLRVTLPLSLPGVFAGTLLTFIPACRRFHQRSTARDAPPVHDRQRHPVPVPGVEQLPAGRGAVVPADGGDHARGAPLRATAGNRTAHGSGGGGRRLIG